MQDYSQEAANAKPAREHATLYTGDLSLNILQGQCTDDVVHSVVTLNFL